MQAFDCYLRAVMATTEPLVLLWSFIRASVVLSLDDPSSWNHYSRVFGVDWLKRKHLPLAQTIFGVVAVVTTTLFFFR